MRLPKPPHLCAIPGCEVVLSRRDRTHCMQHRPQNVAAAGAAAERLRIIDTAPLEGRVVIVAGKDQARVARWDLEVWLYIYESLNFDELEQAAASVAGSAVFADVITLWPCPPDLAALAEWPTI